MCLAELRTMALIENKYDPFVFELFHFSRILLLADGRIQFLNGGDNQFCIVGELFDQCFCVVGAIDAPFAETIELAGGLIIQVLPVNNENNLFYFWQMGKYLAGFERGERFARTSGVPYKSWFVAYFYLLYYCFGGIILIRCGK